MLDNFLMASHSIAKIAILVVLLFAGPVALAADNFTVKSVVISEQPTAIKVFDQNPSGITFQLELGTIDLVPLNTKGGIFLLPRSDGLTRSHRVGEPNLPTANRLIMVPAGAQLTAQVLDFAIEEIDLKDYGFDRPLMPVQPSLSKSASAEDIPFEFNDAVYELDRYYSLPPAKTEILGRMRSVRIGRVSIAPIQYNPVQNRLRIYSRMTVRVSFDNPDWSATKDDWRENYSPYFDPLFSGIVGYSELAAEENDLTRYPVKYAIVADRMFETQLQPFIEWKVKKGFLIDTAYTDVIGGTQYDIKNHLESLYLSGTAGDPAPTFVLLVGDDDQIPAYFVGGHKTDFYYCEYTGDYFPEAYYGRFSAESTADLQPQIDKTLEYERYEMSDPAFLGEATLVSGVDSYNAPTYGNGQINYGTQQYFNVAHGIDPHVWLYPESDENGVTDSVIETINNGVGFINYTAHCGHTGWSNPAFTTTHISLNLTNAHKYPLSIGNCCQTNTFGNNQQTPCFGEVWLRSEDKGGIGHIGGTDDTYWEEDYWWAVGYGPLVGSGPTYEQTGLGAFDGVFHDHGEPVTQHYITNGAIVFGGNMAVTEAGSLRTSYYWEIYALMGDPSVMTYLGVPTANTVSYPEHVSLLDSVFTVTAVPGSYVGLSMNGQLFGQGYVDASGTVDLEFTPFSETGSAELVVTAQNKIPYMASITVTPLLEPYLIFDSHTINDQIAGNGNGEAESGESIVLGIQIQNIGGTQADDVEVTLSTEDAYVTITDDHEIFGNIAPDYSVVNVEDAFAFDLAAATPDDHLVEFNLVMMDGSLNEWGDTFSVVIKAVSLSLGTVELNDASGNNNGYADPGETVELVVTLENSGGGQANNVSGSLSTAHPQVTVDVAGSDFGTIGGQSSGDNVTNPFAISIDPACPVGSSIIFDLTLSGDFGFTAILNLEVVIGFRVEFHYDDFSFDQGWSDLGGPAEWQIGPAAGGIGTDGWGEPDPTQDHSPGTDNKILGNDLGTELDGDYAPGLSTTYYVTSPTIDCSQFNGVMLSFYRWLGVQAQNADLADIQAFDGSTWITIFASGEEVIDDAQWTYQEHDVSEAADSNPDFKIRFGLGRTNDWYNYCGWNIDDLSLRAYGECKSGEIGLDVNPLMDSLVSDVVADDTLLIFNLSPAESLYIQFAIPTESWLDCSTEPIYIPPLESHGLTVQINATDLQPGDYIGVLPYASNDYRHKLGGVEVLLHIYAPAMDIPTETIVRTIESGGLRSTELNINNPGLGLLEYTVSPEMITSPEANWLSVSPLEGEIQPGNSGSVMINFDAANLENGTYSGQVAVTGNDPVITELIVPLTLKVIVCGDANNDGSVNISDVVFIMAFIFHAGTTPYPYESADANGDGSVNIADAVYLANLVFKGGPAPICP